MVILLSFTCVLFGTVGAKVAMFLMTSQIRPHKTTAFCNVEIDRSRTYIAEIAGAEQVVWVWVLFVSFCIPEVFTFLRSMRMVCFKSPTRATAMDTLIVIAMESLSMVGLGLLAFYVWPNLDVIKGAMLTNCVAFTPGINTHATCWILPICPRNNLICHFAHFNRHPLFQASSGCCRATAASLTAR